VTRAASPTSLAEALRVLAADPGVRPVAGCTDLLVGAGERSPLAEPVMDVTRIAEITGITNREGAWRIGAAATFTRIQRHEALCRAFPILADAASQIGGRQIQNRATLGGNLANASPAGDSLPVLLVLDATVILIGPGGERRVPYARFHLGYRKTALLPGEILAWVVLPEPAPGTIQAFQKVGTRAAQSISKVVAASALRRDGDRLRDVRLAAGSVAPVPVRLRAAEAVCEGAAIGSGPSDRARLAERAAAAARDETSPIDDIRSTASYRAHVLGACIRTMILKAGEP
jgi:CO/xanthine dehydrogenase FAD-binding subunit